MHKSGVQVTNRGFRILLVSCLATFILLVGCGSGNTGNTGSNSGSGSGGGSGATGSVRGTASMGAPIVGATVTLKDSTGQSTTATTASDGTYTLNTSGMTPPYFVQVVTSSGTTLYSVSADALPSTTINANVLTDLIIRTWYSTQGVNVNSAFANPVISSNVPPSPTVVQIISNTVIQIVQLWFNNAGVTVVAGTPANNTQVNLISSSIPANDTGVDAVLHLTTETVDPNTGAVTQIAISDGTTTQTSPITYNTSAGTITANTTTTNGTATSSETVTGVSPNDAQQAAINGINTAFTNFANVANAKGSALTASDILPFFASNYLNGGLTSAQDAADFASQLAGGTVSFQILQIKSVNTTTGVADVVFNFNLSKGSQSQAQTNEFFFEQSGSNWLLMGDQKIAKISFSQQTRNTLQTNVGGPNGAYLNVDLQAPQGELQIPASPTTTFPTAQQISGSLPVWSTPGTNNPGVSSQFFNYSGIEQNSGVNLDHFFVGSNVLTSLVPAGTPFTVTLAPITGNPVSYPLVTNVGTNELVSMTSPTDGVLADYTLGQPVTFNWTLPKTYAIGEIKLDGQAFDGNQNLGTTVACNVPNFSTFDPTVTSGQLTLPTMCNGVPVVQININVQIFGVNGEEADAFLFLQ